MSTVIVGNGKPQRDGAWIDAHDVVIRMNGFQIAGYENVVGGKTTIWAFSVGNWPWIEPPAPPDDKAWMFYDEVRDAKRDLAAIGMRVPYAKEVFDNAAMDAYKKRIVKSTGIKLNHISTGMRTIMQAINTYAAPIELVGFDGYTSAYHYYEDDPGKAARSQKAHDFAAEQRVITALDALGLVTVYNGD